MTDRAVPNLPSRDLAATAEFYGSFGFVELHRDENWLITRRGDLQLEFFAKHDLEPLGHDFACCLRLADLDGFYADVLAAGVPEQRFGLPSVRAPETAPWGQRLCAVLDPDGVLLRVIEDDDPPR